MTPPRSQAEGLAGAGEPLIGSMATGRGDLKSPLGPFLTTDVSEVDPRVQAHPTGALPVRRIRQYREAIIQGPETERVDSVPTHVASSARSKKLTTRRSLGRARADLCVVHGGEVPDLDRLTGGVRVDGG